MTTQPGGVDRFEDRCVGGNNPRNAQMRYMLTSEQPTRTESRVQSSVDLLQVEALHLVVATDVTLVRPMSQELDEQPKVDEERIDGRDPQSDRNRQRRSASAQLGPSSPRQFYIDHDLESTTASPRWAALTPRTSG
jgi:hypothetical protein